MANTIASEQMKISSAARLTWRGDRNETPRKIASAASRKKAWRLTKWKVERPSRSATGGPPAISSTTPETMSATSAPRMMRSIDHHQRPLRLGSARETIVAPPMHGRGVAPLANHSVNEWLIV